MHPLDKIVKEEMAEIKHRARDQVVSAETLAGFVGISTPYLINILRGRKRGDVSIIVRLVCALGASPDRAEEILHAAGYDIGMDWAPCNPEFRAAISSRSLEEANEHLEAAGTYISGRYRRS